MRRLRIHGLDLVAKEAKRSARSRVMGPNFASIMPQAVVVWREQAGHGVRFDETLSAIEEAVPVGSIDFAAESSLSLLSEPHLQRLRRNSFQALLPGIKSWYSLGNKSKTGRSAGLDKLKQVSEHVNMILRYVPCVQKNFVLGLDEDAGAEPFELTKLFVDLVPGARCSPPSARPRR